MSKVSGVNSTDTVSSMGIEETIPIPRGSGTDFNYTYFCKSILRETIRKMDASFLVPLKMYKEVKEIRQEDFLSVLGVWMDNFCGKRGSIDHFWVYMAYDGGYYNMKCHIEGTSSGQNISDKAREDALTHMNDVSKLGNAKYIARLCENRDDVECWILRVYEITLSKMFTAEKMATKMKNVITYLKECSLRVEMPFITSQEQADEEIFQSAANLFLLVIRLRLGIVSEQAVKWYKNGNVAFFRYRDQMLEEFTRLNSLYFCQSYERYLKMREIADHNKNKYAAKEVGDILRLGMELQDSHGNRVFVKPDKEMACEYYRICIDANYIPAYVPAVKTGALINGCQQKELLRTALEEKNPESLAYHAEKLLIMADELLHTDQERAIHALRDATDALISLEDTYGEKHVLKVSLLRTETFQTYNSLDSREPELDDNLRELYSMDSAKMKEDIVLSIVENAYLCAQKYGFYEAEYELGMLFLENDKAKSERYFEQGVKKGCNWCRLEYAKMQRQNAPRMWLSIMIEIARHMQGDDVLQIALAEDWVDAEDIFAKAANGQIELEENEIAEIYVQINNMIHNIYKCNQNMSNSKIEKTIGLCSKLMQCKEEIKKLLKKNDS